MRREVELVLLPGFAKPLRENVMFSPNGQIDFSPEDYGLSERLSAEIYNWAAAWENNEQPSSEAHKAWGRRIARDLKRELGDEFVVTYVG